ncbi:MAG: hypothetical protein QOI47_1469, partial [Actinomycetota bacterium]|nr:hypothetical protein [Actinomycetota bacterium]
MYARPMRRILAGLLIGGMLATGCSGGSSPLQTVRAAAGKTTSVTSARMSMSITSASGPLAKGLMYDGAFNFAEHRGRFTFDASSLGIPGSAGAFAMVIDASKGSVVYVKYPQISRLLP